MIKYRDPKDFTVLNLDDTEAIRYAKTRALQKAGYKVIEATTGAEALRLVAEHRPALALLDVKLPDMNGIEVCRIIKRDYPGVLVLQISATFITAGDRVRGLESGADAYLVQPVSSDELTASVGALLRTRRGEDALRLVNERLEERVAQSREALQRQITEREKVEATLRQSQKMEAIGHLTGGIAHDFNNLLMAVLGNLEMTERRIAQGRTDVSGYISNAVEAARRAAALTQRLLTFARQQPLSARYVDIRKLLAGMDSMIVTSIGESIRVTMDIADNLKAAWCDGHQLENAILNLCINARDAMPSGGLLMISAETVALDEDAVAPLPDIIPGDYVRVRVADTGAGMPPDIAARAFDPFFTTKPQGQGTGLGLAMIYSFVRQSHGMVDLNSRVGRGTEVSLYLPVAQREATDEVPSIDRAPISKARGETILVVEDEPLVRGLLVEGLSEQGYSCLEADSAREALEIAESGISFDLLISDIGLPGRMNGQELARRIISSRPGLRALLISGHAGGINEAEAAGSEAFSYLSKPFDMDDLSAKVREALDQTPVQTPA